MIGMWWPAFHALRQVTTSPKHQKKLTAKSSAQGHRFRFQFQFQLLVQQREEAEDESELISPSNDCKFLLGHLDS
jgi:hypothetical protein